MARALYATDHRRGTMLAAVGVTILSFDALLVRMAMADAADVAFWRGLFIALAVTLAMRVLRGRWAWTAVREGGPAACALILTMGLTQILFVVSVMNTSVANVVIILTAAPLFAAALSGIFLGEWVPPRTWLAMIICIIGIVLVFGSSLDTGNWLGDGLALAMALIVAANLTQWRRSPGVSRLAVVAGSGIFACLLVLPFADPGAVGARSLLVLAVMGLLQMPVAMVMMTEATRHLPSAEVALFLVIEAILGTFWVWLVLAEEPPAMTLAGGTVILCTLAAHSWLALHGEQRP